MKIDNATLRGDQISFDLPIGAQTYRFTGKVENSKMAGNALTSGGSRPVPWRASKLPPDTK
jgi:hypothetical protein